MSMNYRYIFTLIMMSLATWCYGQSLNLRFDHITSEQGLPQNTIHGIAKDKYGFMWFGTWSGLCKYDGYQMRVYQYDPNNQKSIANSRIHNIIKDADDQIWVITFDEQMACRYNYETDDFDRIPLADLSAEFQERLSRRSHYLTVSFTYQNYRWDLDDQTNTLTETFIPTGETKHHKANPTSRWGLNDAYVSDIYLDEQDMLWLGTYSNGINKANLRANPFHYYHHDPAISNSIIDNNVRAICEDRQGNFWIGTRDKGISIVGRNGNHRHLRHHSHKNSISHDQIKSLFCDSTGYMWVGTKKGIDRYDPKTGRIRHFDMG